jgi:phage replication O-like protein O
VKVQNSGHVRIPNDFMDALIAIRISGEARQVFDFIIRKTWGWSKECDVISLSQFVEATGIRKPAIVKIIKKLLIMRLIIVEFIGKKKKYSINKNINTWQPLPKKITGYKRKSSLLKFCYICKFNEAIHRHHIKPINEGGLDRVVNIIILCPNCHALVHKGRYTPESLVILKDNTESVCKKDNADLQKSKKELSKKRHTKDTSFKTTLTKTKTLTEKEKSFRELFWPVYPLRKGRKSGKKEALELFIKISKKNIEKVLIGVRHYAVFVQHTGEYPKDADTWLRNEKWGEWQHPYVPEPPPLTPNEQHLKKLKEEEGNADKP